MDIKHPALLKGDKYSQNLRKYAKKLHSHSRFLGENRSYGDVFRDVDGNLHMGIMDDMFLIGAQMSHIICDPSTGVYANRNIAKMTPIPDFWGRYAEDGRCAIDPDHSTAFIGDETRWMEGFISRTCLWCGKHSQRLHRRQEIVHREQWEPMTDTDRHVITARVLAIRAHADQTDKAGEPYIEHVARVAQAVSDDPVAEAVAWLHDVAEDAPAHAASVALYPPEISEAAALLNRHAAPSAEEYYRRIRENPVALRVKLADIADNADESRLAKLDRATANRLRRKYHGAILMLLE